MEIIENGGVTSAKGFCANGIKIGLKASGNKDLALIYSEVPAVCAGAFTRNLVQAAPIVLCKERVKEVNTQAIIVNSGNANACTGAPGLAMARLMTQLVAQKLNLKENAVLVASTGVIGVPLDEAKIRAGIEAIIPALARSQGMVAAEAIMTTDTKAKHLAVHFELEGKIVTLGGIAKGSGMIHPNMGTMLAFITTDLAIDQQLLQTAFAQSVEDSYNMVSVDGDTSTNDCGLILANGCAGNSLIRSEAAPGYVQFKEALDFLNKALAKKIAEDGEGATKLIEVTTHCAGTIEDAKKVAKAVIGSSLVKSAIFGGDANWGRILCAVGYSGATLSVAQIEVFVRDAASKIQIVAAGAGIAFDEAVLASIFQSQQINIDIYLNDGTATATAWGCDLTYDYVKINADYRT